MDYKFLDDEHKNRFFRLVQEDGMYVRDLERTALFYIMAGNMELYLKRKDFYDFKTHMRTGNKRLSVLSTSGKGLLMLGFNLYNGNNYKNANITDIFSSLDKRNIKLALNAITLRFNAA